MVDKQKSKSGKSQEVGTTREGKLSTADKLHDSSLPPQKPPRQRTQKGTCDAIHEEIPPLIPEKSGELNKDLSNEEIPLKHDSTPTQGAYCCFIFLTHNNP